MQYKRFEDLPIWQLSLEVTKIIYDYTSNERWCRDFALRDQIRRAIISVSSNIVEGFEKNYNNEFVRFLKISKGSTGEVRNQLYIAHAILYINKDEFDQADGKLQELAKQIGGLIKYLEEYKKANNS